MTMSLAGYLICWADEADLGDGNREQFAPASFANTGAKLTFGHDPRAGASLGHARVTQDAHGAKFVATLDEHDRDARRVLVAIRNGLNSCSFQFRTLAMHKDGDLTIVTSALLLEVSVVPSLATPVADAGSLAMKITCRRGWLRWPSGTPPRPAAVRAAARACPYAAARVVGWPPPRRRAPI